LQSDYDEVYTAWQPENALTYLRSPSFDGWQRYPRWCGEQAGCASSPLDATALNRSLTHLGSAHTLLSQLRAGLPVSIGVIGASVAQNGGCFQEHRRCAAHSGRKEGFAKGFAVRFLEDLNATWPHPQHALTNGALGATPPRVLLPCLLTHLPATLHLVVVEYLSIAQYVKPLNVERLVRTLLLAMHPRPSIVFVNVRRFCDGTAEASRPLNTTPSLWPRSGPIARAERRIFDPLCRRYGASCLSLHRAVWPLLSSGGLAVRDVAQDGLHISTGRLGPALLASLLAHWLRRAAAAGPGSSQNGLHAIEPLHEGGGAAPRTARCYTLTQQQGKRGARSSTSQLLGAGQHPEAWHHCSPPASHSRRRPRCGAPAVWRTAACTSALPGGALQHRWGACEWQPASEACDQYRSSADAAGAWMHCATTLPLDASGRLLPARRRVSPGLVALAPGALLDVQLDTRLASGHSDSTAVVLSIEYLTSYLGHGVVAARCARGCRCDERLIDAHVPSSDRTAPNASMFLDFELRATGASADCALQLLVLATSASGQHKFKIRHVNAYAAHFTNSA
jgi:hypothetical protein